MDDNYAIAYKISFFNKLRSVGLQINCLKYQHS